MAGIFDQIPGIGNLPGLGGNITDITGVFLGKGWIGGAILFITSAELVDAIESWLKVVTFMFGNHEGTMNAISETMTLPYVSPVASLVKPELLPTNIRPEDTFGGLLSSLPDKAMGEVKKVVTESPLLNSFIKPGSAVGQLLGFQPPAIVLDINEQTEKKSESLLTIIQNEINPVAIGDKFLNENDLVKSVKEFGGDLTGKWLKIDNFEDIGSVVGEAVADAKGIVNSLTGLVEGLNSTVQSLMEEVRRMDQGIVDLKEDGFNFARDTITQVENVIPSLQFSLLMIPPQIGGPEELRLIVRNMFQSGVENVPEVDENALVFPISIVFQGAFEFLVRAQYDILRGLLNQVV